MKSEILPKDFAGAVKDIKLAIRMRMLFEVWSDVISIRPLPMAELGEEPIRSLPTHENQPSSSVEIRHLSSDEMPANKGVVEFAVRDKSKPLGIATYRTFRSIPKPYRALAPVIEGVRRVLAESAAGKKAVTPKRRKGRNP